MDYNTITSKNILLLNKVVARYTSLFLDQRSSKYAVELLELVIHYELTDLLLDYLNLCITEIIKNPENVLRANDNYSVILTRFVEICLDKKFDNVYCNDNLLGNLFIICADAPQILRKVCNKLFNDANKLDPILGYRAVCILVIFRYYLAKVIIQNISDRSKIIECKNLQKNINFDGNIDIRILSLIKIITAEDIGNDIIFVLNQSTINKYVSDVISVCNKEFSDDLEIIKLCGEIYGDIKYDNCNNTGNTGNNVYNDVENYVENVTYMQMSKTVPIIRRKSYIIKNENKIFSVSPKSIEITKYLLNAIGLSIYDDIIDKHKVTHYIFFELDKNKLSKFGIINKKHQKSILMLIKKCNKLMDFHNININNTSKLFELLATTTI